MNENKEPIIEAETVPAQAVVVRQQPGGAMASINDLEQGFALAVRQRELLSNYIKNQLKEGKHFYEVKGQQKKSLTKEGAEIILLPHGLVPDYQLISGPEAPPEGNAPYQITAKCTLRYKGDPNSFVGSALGSAGSHHGYWDKEDRKWTYKPRQPDRYLCHNATLKMAQKSAMIAATINSTAASEFFTQDMEPGAAQEAPEPKTAPKPNPAPKAAPMAPPALKTTKIPADAVRCREKFVKNLDEAKLREKASQYLIDLAWMLPTEALETLELRYVPLTKEEYLTFIKKLTAYAVSGKAEKPYPPHWEAAPTAKPPEPEKPEAAPAAKDEEWWRDVIVPVPRKGQKRDEYLKHPDTIGSLFEARHGTDDESNAMRQRLWGFLNNFEPKPWVGKDGKERPPNKADVQFREALDAFGDWFEKNHPGEEL